MFNTDLSDLSEKNPGGFCCAAVVVGGLSIFIMPYVLMWVWNTLAGNFNFQPINSYWVGLAGWLGLNIFIKILESIFKSK